MYDVAVIGAGLGGLQTAYLLAKKGMKVIVLEQGKLLGGCLQTFKRGSQCFDTGFHYIGGMDEGQPLNRIFKLFNLIDLPWVKMDTQGFDHIYYQDKKYLFKNGYENFREQMTEYFPSQKENLKNYTAFIQEIGENIFEAFNRTQEEILNSESPFSKPAKEYLDSVITDENLKNVLSGTSPKLPLTDKLPLYHFAQINSSFIQSAYRIKGGGMQIAQRLAENIKKFGGEILTDSKVISLEEKNGEISAVEILGKGKIEVKNVVSNVHPKELMSMLDKVTFVRAAQKRRYAALENSFGMFTVNIALKKDVLKYQNNNIYIHKTQDIWNEGSQKASSKPSCALISYTVPEQGDYAQNIDILTPMLYKDVEKFDNGSLPMHRGKEYEDFKLQKAQQLLDLAQEYVPGIKNAVDKFYVSTPLTYQNYTSTAQGSAYGLIKKMPFQKLAANIYWTGQNIGLHGILGVSMTSLLTFRLITGELPQL
jgi:phytoene dehydrogenase-like protein